MHFLDVSFYFLNHLLYPFLHSLTLNKLRQKQMLEEKLEKRRAMRMQKLEQKHENENKVCEQFTTYTSKVSLRYYYTSLES